MRRLLILAAPLLALAGCATEPLPAVALDEVRIDSRGFESGGDFCADFTLTAAQARYFLARSVVVTARQQHDSWEVLPCYVRGTARSASGVWHWEIRAGGTATLETPAGDTELRGCSDCDAVLGKRGARRRP
jgi:hypothetical protein